MTEQPATPLTCATCREAQAAHLLVFDGVPVGLFCPACGDQIVTSLTEHPGPPGSQIAVYRFALHLIPNLPEREQSTPERNRT
ncbi:hypothetical protein [Nonomuraea sp. NPDC005650]|uniref:hypothetical protein n=1 Tax=Nonomuraea sp. NPDC005650 TaxID=3157045 RepID=UPI0033A043AC